MTIAVSTQTGGAHTRKLENKPKVQEQKEVSFWSKDWTAGNFVREKFGWDGLADWLDDKDKVCTDGKDDGKLGFGETMESFGKGLAGLVKGAMNHPIATAVTIGVGAAAVALTSGAILPFMVAAGATMGAGMIGVGAYNAATADTDAEAKQAWETIGTGTFTVGASALSAKSALDQAYTAGVKNAIATKNPIKNLVNCFKSIPECLKVSKGNALTNLTGALAPNAPLTTQDMRGYIDSKGNVLKQKIVPEGTKYIDSKGIVTVETESILISDKSGNLHHIPYKDLLNQYGITESHIKGLPQQKVVDIIFKNVNIENALKIHANSTHMDAPISGGRLFAREMQGGTSACIKAEILHEKGVELMYGYNNYNGGDPLLGYKVNGKLYELPDLHCNIFNKHASVTDYIIAQLETQTFPAATTEDAIIAKHSVIDFLYSK